MFEATSLSLLTAQTMTYDLRIQKLVEETLDSGRSPDEVCRDSPELLPEVRKQWNRLRSVEAQIEALFPSSIQAGTGFGAPSVRPAAVLPQIIGYDVQAILGHGGMGVVYRARHLKLNRTVALKMLLSGEYASRQELSRFMQEAESIAALRHSHIVQVHDVGDLDGRPYFTMEFLEGGTLAQKLAGTPQPARETATLLAALAKAVHAAHQAGIAHRDLKPANILLTADGTPKITDFGLARRFDRDPTLTESGAKVGTPSYMAPEQAMGTARAFCPSVDVYSLGAILYEMLTGRPPFRAETPSETQRQVIAEQPVPPSRLNAKVPRDLQTICLKCLHKDPHRRYASAELLAEDLHRYLRGEPISARPAGWLERAVRWCKRNPRETALVGLVFIVTALVASAALWLDHERVSKKAEQFRQHERALIGMEGALDQAKTMRLAAGWSQAERALDQADVIVADDEPLRARVAHARQDLHMAAELDQIRQAKATIKDGKLDSASAPPAYARAFGTYGLAIADNNVEESAARISASKMKQELVDALDDWAFIEPDRLARDRLTAVARQVDPDPWRDRVRDPKAWNDPAALVELGRRAPVSEQSVQLLVALGMRLWSITANGDGAAISNHEDFDAVGFLRRVQQAHPGDFWANFALANALVKVKPDDAIGYYRAALAIRPQEVVVYYNLGSSMRTIGQLDEAVGYLEQAVHLDPTSAKSHNNLGTILSDQGQFDEAIDHYTQALKLDSTFAEAQANIGAAFIQQGRFDEAIDQCRQALQLNPQLARAHASLGLALQSKSRIDQAIDEYEQAIQLDPTSVMAHSNLGYALQTKGRLDEAIEHCNQALKLDPNYAKAHNNLGLALQDKGRFDQAIDEFKQAFRLDPKDPRPPNNLGRILGIKGQIDEALNYYQQALDLDPNSAEIHSNVGAVLAQQNRFEDAIEHFQQALQLDPAMALAHANLGAALLNLGRFSEARAASQRFLDLLPDGSRYRGAAVQQLQDCDLMLALEARLPAVLAGDDKPTDSAECLQFADLCRCKKQFATCAHFYAEAFAGTPRLAEDVSTNNRYNAACIAALAGAGKGDDAVNTNDDERARWREQARQWLRAELVERAKKIDGDESTRRVLLQALTQWRADPDLSGIRDAAELARLPADERDACRALWTDMDDLLDRIRNFN